jgi:hypothetical protein
MASGLKLVHSAGIPTIKERWMVEEDEEEKVEEHLAIVKYAHKLSQEYARAKADLEAQSRQVAEQLQALEQQATDRERQQVRTGEVDAATEGEFRAHADKWLQETAPLSDPVQIFMHPSHLKIIGMGGKALPFILREVERQSGHWFVALEAISPVNPVQPEDQTSFQRMTDAWIRWGKEEGLID